MTSRQGILLFFIGFVFCSLVLPRTSAAENGQEQLSARGELQEGFVYYADSRKSVLKSVKIRFPSSLDARELGMEIISVLLQGPQDPLLEPTWPESTGVKSFFITDDGKAYVDLDLEPSDTAFMDAGLELLAVYSMVNSLTLNIPEIKMVKLLIKGTDALTLAGHIDIDTFYQTNMLIVK